MTLDQLQREVLKLPVAERARLAEWIASNLDVEVEIEREWLAEVRRRDGEMEAGEVPHVVVEDALASVRARFGGERPPSTLPPWKSSLRPPRSMKDAPPDSGGSSSRRSGACWSSSARIPPWRRSSSLHIGVSPDAPLRPVALRGVP